MINKICLRKSDNYLEKEKEKQPTRWKNLSCLAKVWQGLPSAPTTKTFEAANIRGGCLGVALLSASLLLQEGKKELPAALPFLSPSNLKGIHHFRVNDINYRRGAELNTAREEGETISSALLETLQLQVVDRHPIQKVVDQRLELLARLASFGGERKLLLLGIQDTTQGTSHTLLLRTGHRFMILNPRIGAITTMQTTSDLVMLLAAHWEQCYPNHTEGAMVELELKNVSA